VFEKASKPAQHLVRLRKLRKRSVSLIPFHFRGAATEENEDGFALAGMRASGFLESLKDAVCRGKRRRSILEV
jgi:hypothetical protein